MIGKIENNPAEIEKEEGKYDEMERVSELLIYLV
jgi:hypothetical protein